MLLGIGSVIQERYQLEAQLGSNGNRQTWLALDRESNTLVTIKALYFGQGMEWQDYKLFEREGQTLQSLSHPHIPCYHQSLRLQVPGGVYYCLVQDYIPGGSLADCVQTGQRFQESAVVRIAESVLSILIFLHGQSPPVIHRDIKPSNLILGEDEQIYLVDFGAVQAGAAAGGTVTIVGTYGYMPLEQFAGRTVPASDLYALGATLLYLLTGQDPAELMDNDSRLQIPNHLPISYGLRSWLSRLVEPNVERRFQRADQSLEALQIRDQLVASNKPGLPANRLPNCDIRLHASKNKLDILIPQRRYGAPNGWNIVLIIFSGFQVVTTGARLLSLIPVMISSPVGFFIILVSGLWLAFWGTVLRLVWNNRQRVSGFFRIQLDSDHFQILRSHTPSLANPYHMVKGKTSEIVSVEEAIQNHPDGEIFFCVQSGDEFMEHAFALGLTSQERYWLIGQIRKWLQD